MYWYETDGLKVYEKIENLIRLFKITSKLEASEHFSLLIAGSISFLKTEDIKSLPNSKFEANKEFSNAKT